MDGKIFVVIPTLNEADHLPAVLEALLADEERDRMQICVIDGGSTDGTHQVVQDPHFKGVEVHHNPWRVQAAAVNLGAVLAIRRGGFKYLVRIDAHAEYPDNFVSTLIRTQRLEQANSVVVPMHTLGGNRFQDLSAMLFNSWLGNGGAAHRTVGRRGFVDHGHHALFTLDSFLQAGGYDPRFAANEDSELDFRLNRLGFRIFLEPAAAIGYKPRSSFAGLWHQMRRNGFYRIQTFAKHSSAPTGRQLGPMLVCPLFAATLVLAPFGLIFAAPALLYILLVLFLSVIACRRSQSIAISDKTNVAILAILMHLAFSIGAISAIAQLYLRRRGWLRELRRQGAAELAQP